MTPFHDAEVIFQLERVVLMVHVAINLIYYINLICQLHALPYDIAFCI
jgi:hypothetical protein